MDRGEKIEKKWRKDPYMAELVRERFANIDNVKVVSKLPFNISTDVIKLLLPVDAAVVAFRLKQAVDYPAVNSAFNGKRKMLRKSLQHICSSSEIEEALRNINLQATSRPEELTIEDFVNLHGVIVKNSMFAYDDLED
ncbi:ribosomal RNA small subunit methyltransferase, chloroplastic-like [Apium graveolens]|uniref:ribosomal RNA small subunit methyltransferase, chloroplastic-like n=1 Tax=Apium graveolens TaxID=4045 RepID=UPI003D7B7B6B